MYFLCTYVQRCTAQHGLHRATGHTAPSGHEESHAMSDVIDRPATATTSVDGDIPKTMQAVVCYAPGDYRLEEVDVPTPGPGEILCRVELVGICMSDVKVYHGAPSFWGDDTQPRYVKPPMIPGHEFVCRVV